MIFQFQRAFATGDTDDAPAGTTSPNLNIPNHLPFGNQPPTRLRLLLNGTGTQTVDVTVWAAIESGRDFASGGVGTTGLADAPARTWVALESVTLTNGTNDQTIEGIGRGGLYIQITGDAAAAGGTILGSILP